MTRYWLRDLLAAVACTAVIAGTLLTRGGIWEHVGGETVRFVVDEPERVALDATVAADAMLVLTDTYYPGWYATVDGSPAEIWRADHMFRGILLGAGVHRVELRYAPRSFLLGAALSAFGLAIVGALLRPAARSRSLV